MSCYNLTENSREQCSPRISTTNDQLEVCQGFIFEQEPVYLCNARASIDDSESGMCVMAFNECVVCLWDAFLIAVYQEYWLWYVPRDIIAFVRYLGMEMEVALGSRQNVHELLELVEVIDLTGSKALPNVWRCRTSWTCDYHSGRAGTGGYFVYYDPRTRCKSDQKTARSCAAGTNVKPDDVQTGWKHEKNDVPYTLRDASYDSYRHMVLIPTTSLVILVINTRNKRRCRHRQMLVLVGKPMHPTISHPRSLLHLLMKKRQSFTASWQTPACYQSKMTWWYSSRCGATYGAAWRAATSGPVM